MKRTTLILALLATLLCPTLLRAQQPDEGVASNAVKTNVISPLFRTPVFSYERRIGSRLGLQLDFGGNFLQAQNQSFQTYALFVQPQVRFYLVRQRRSGVMPFVAAGINYTYAWQYLDSYVGNRGWEIETERYKVSSQRHCPSFMIGLKVNIPFGLTLESTFGFMVDNDDEYRPLIDNVEAKNYFGTLLTTRIGWAF